MIYLLTVMFTLWLAEPVGAEAQRDPPGYHNCVHRGNGVQLCEKLPPTPDPCLTKMEAAMRAMEPHLGKGLTMFWITPEEGKRHDENMRIKQQWDDAAKACWRKQ